MGGGSCSEVTEISLFPGILLPLPSSEVVAVEQAGGFWREVLLDLLLFSGGREELSKNALRREELK